MSGQVTTRFGPSRAPRSSAAATGFGAGGAGPPDADSTAPRRRARRRRCSPSPARGRAAPAAGADPRAHPARARPVPHRRFTRADRVRRRAAAPARRSSSGGCCPTRTCSQRRAAPDWPPARIHAGAGERDDRGAGRDPRGAARGGRARRRAHTGGWCAACWKSFTASSVSAPASGVSGESAAAIVLVLRPTNPLLRHQLYPLVVRRPSRKPTRLKPLRQALTFWVRPPFARDFARSAASGNGWSAGSSAKLCPRAGRRSRRRCAASGSSRRVPGSS